MTNGMPQLTLEPQLGEAAVEKQTVKSEPEKMDETILTAE